MDAKILALGFLDKKTVTVLLACVFNSDVLKRFFGAFTDRVAHPCTLLKKLMFLVQFKGDSNETHE